MIASVIVSAIQYVKIESGLKYEESVGGVIVTAGKFYHENKVEIPSTYDGKKVVGIGDGAFNNNEDIISVSLPISIKNIGQNAFRNCRNLKTVDFRNRRNNVGIGDHAFSGCTSLGSINLEYADTIGEGAFKGCEMLGQAVLNDDIICLPKDAFNGCLRLKNIVLPANLSKIDERCFSGCQNLKVITIPESVETIGSNVFDGCIGLVRIILEYREGDLSGFSDMWLSGVPATTIVNVGFRITLDYNGATDNVLENKTIVSVGESFILPVPARIGYKFVGWYDGKKDANKFTDEKGRSLVEYDRYESVTVYAIWEANLNEIVFNANGGEGEMNNQKVATDATFALNECLYTKKGYTFAGWGTTANGEVNYSDKAEYMMGTNAQYVLYAIWTPNNNTLHFESNGGSGKMPDITIATDAKGTLSANAFTKTGYDFVGWAEAENGSKVYSDGDSYTMGTENATLYALWTPKTYKITYNLNGGQTAVKNKNTYTIETATFTLNNPTQRGYEFKGWSGSNLIGNENKTVSIETGVYGELTFTANWTAIDYSITYNLEGGINNSANPTTYTVEQELHLLDPEKEGYKFNGWTYSGTIPKGSIGEKTFTASWRVINYKISYDLGGGSNNKQNKSTYNIEDEEIILAAPTRPGYTFNGWTNEGTIPAHSTGDREFVASWTANKNTLKFNANGGNGNLSDITMLTDETKELPDNTFKRKGYEFKGWATTADGSVQYLNLSAYKMGPNSETVLYAVWALIIYTIDYNLNNGVADKNPTEYSVKTESFSLATPKRDGYTFTGWSGTDINGQSVSVIVEKDSIGNRFYVANWQANLNVVLFSDGVNTIKTTGHTDEYIRLPKNTFEKENYEFKGWSTTQGGEVEYYDRDLYRVGPNSSYTLYTVWAENIDRTGWTPISTIEELNNIRNNLSGKYYLISDLDMNGYEWTPIGARQVSSSYYYSNEDNSFKGVFDGNGYVLYNFTSKTLVIDRVYKVGDGSDRTYTLGWGLFGYNKGTIKNVKIYDSNIKSDFQLGGAWNCWEMFYVQTGLVCSMNSGTIQDCYAQGNVSFTSDKPISNLDKFPSGRYLRGVSLGGICGNDYGIFNCSADVSITSNVNSTMGQVAPNIENIKYLTAENLSPWSEWYIKYACQNGTFRYQFAKWHSIVNAWEPFESKDGYTFAGWALSNDGPIKYHTGDECFIPLDKTSLTLYPVWQANINEVVFNSNGGSGEMQNQQIQAGVTASLSANAFTKAGYHFIGWAATPDGQVLFEDKADYTMGIKSSYDLYAVWEQDVNNIVFKSNGGSGTMKNQQALTNTTITLNQCAFDAPTGYYFAGWAEDPNGDAVYLDGASFNVGTNDIYTLYAIWKKI